MALTDVEIRNARPRDRAFKLHDECGLFLLVTPSGGKLWRLKYRVLGKENSVSLGKYPFVSLSAAREKMREARTMLESGGDPAAEKKAKKAAARVNAEKTFKAIALMWHDHWKVNRSSRHAAVTLSRLEANVFPKLGQRPIADIQPSEIIAVVLKINERAPDLAKRALQTCGQVFRFAVGRGYAKTNPVSELRPNEILTPVQKTNMARIEPEEFPALLRAIEIYRGRPVTRLAMKLMSLTFVRTKELIQAQWSEIDFKARRWRIPAHRMKMRSPHTVPLSDQAIATLEMLRTITGSSEWLFPNDIDSTKSMSNNTLLEALDRMGYRGRQTGHGFRGLASTILHEQGYEHEHIETQLAHQKRGVAGAYDHSKHLAARTKMMQDWANFLDAAQRTGKVLLFRVA